MASNDATPETFTATATVCSTCGREVTLLNPLSPEPRCVGCGYPPERCTCTGARYAGQPS